jgi:hypothetical protein
MSRKESKFKRRIRERMARTGETYTQARESERFTSVAGLMDVVTFCESSWGLGLRLYPVQRVALKMAYGLRLDDEHRFMVRVNSECLDEEASFTETGYLRWLHEQGRSNVAESPGEPCVEAVWVMGRRAGKSLLSLVMMAYEACRLVGRKDPQSYFGLSPSSVIQLVHVSVSKDMARGFQSEFSRRLPRGMREHEVRGPEFSVCLTTPSAIERAGVGKPPRKVQARFSDYRTQELRGSGNFLVVLDDVDYVYDGGRGAASALTTSLGTFTKKGSWGETVPGSRVEGRLLLASAPFPQPTSLLRDRYASAMEERGRRAVCLRIPTWEMNPTVPSSVMEEDRQRDREMFRSWWGAEF